jgi:membrane-associated protease RseP (regulator of RpoE activity)
MSRKMSFLASLATIAGLVGPVVLPAQEVKESKTESRIEIRSAGGASGSETLQSPSEKSAKSYRLGLKLEAIHPLVKEQLGLEGGVSVVEVVPESPAAKAKLKARDIILSVGSNAINQPADMQGVLAACGGKALELKFLRGGKENQLNITPELSPELGAAIEGLPAGQLSEKMLGDVQELLKKLNQDGLDLDIEMFGPGIIVQSQSSSKMPENLQIAITKNGNEPAKITVKQNDKTWDITEDKIDELPEELRPHVRSMLGNKITLGDLNAELPGDIGAKIKEKMALAKERVSAAREAQKERNSTNKQEAEFKRIEAEMKRLQEQLQKIQRGAATSLQSPSEQTPPQLNGVSGGTAAAAFSEGISISDGNGTRTQTRSGVKVSK